MKKLAVIALSILFSLDAFAELDSYQVAPGDRLAQILKDHEYGSSYREILPFIAETVRLNPRAFKKANADFIIPGTKIVLPENPNKPVEVVETIPEPEPVPEPEPAPEPEPELTIIGNIIITNGQAEILRDDQIITVVGQGVLVANDIVMTRQSSLAEIKLTDKTRFTLGPNSRLSIDQYRYSAPENSQADAEGSLIATIHEGVMRTISGLLSRLKSNDYRVQSALTVTIGVRGTDFTVRSCMDKASCGDLFGVSAAVLDGGVSFKNQTSEIDLEENQFTLIESSNDTAELLPLPEGFFDIGRPVSEIQVSKSWWQKTLDWAGELF